MTTQAPDATVRTENCRICDLTYPAGTKHRCTDGWTQAPDATVEALARLLDDEFGYRGPDDASAPEDYIPAAQRILAALPGYRLVPVEEVAEPDGGLDAAWKEAEAAIPVWFAAQLAEDRDREFFEDDDVKDFGLRLDGGAPSTAYLTDWVQQNDVVQADGPTPAAALRALATRLSASHP